MLVMFDCLHALFDRQLPVIGECYSNHNISTILTSCANHCIGLLYWRLYHVNLFISRCHLSSGNILWFCKEHQSKDNGRVTVIPSDSNSGQGIQQTLVFEGDNKMLDRILELSSLESKLFGKAFVESCKQYVTVSEKPVKESPKRPPLRRQATSMMLIQSEIRDTLIWLLEPIHCW